VWLYNLGQHISNSKLAKLDKFVWQHICDFVLGSCEGLDGEYLNAGFCCEACGLAPLSWLETSVVECDFLRIKWSGEAEILERLRLYCNYCARNKRKTLLSNAYYYYVVPQARIDTVLFNNI
jgi:hypothetical protein